MTSLNKKNNKYVLKYVVSSKLRKKDIYDICLLKNQCWKFGIKSQYEYFNNNVRQNDLHIMFYSQKRLIGYTLLRRRTCEIKIDKKKIKYFLLDSLIVDKKFRGIGLSGLLMNFNNILIKKSGYFSFLICDINLIEFYKKFGWKKINVNNYFINNDRVKKQGMIFNQLKSLKNFNMYTKY